MELFILHKHLYPLGKISTMRKTTLGYRYSIYWVGNHDLESSSRINELEVSVNMFQQIETTS